MALAEEAVQNELWTAREASGDYGSNTCGGDNEGESCHDGIPLSFENRSSCCACLELLARWRNENCSCADQYSTADDHGVCDKLLA